MSLTCQGFTAFNHSVSVDAIRGFLNESIFLDI